MMIGYDALNDLSVVEGKKRIYWQTKYEKDAPKGDTRFACHEAYFQRLIEHTFVLVEGRFFLCYHTNETFMLLVIEQKDAHNAEKVKAMLLEKFPEEIKGIVIQDEEGFAVLTIIDFFYEKK